MFDKNALRLKTLKLKTRMPKVLMWFKLLENIHLKTSNKEIQKFTLSSFAVFLTGKQIRVQTLNL